MPPDPSSFEPTTFGLPINVLPTAQQIYILTFHKKPVDSSCKQLIFITVVNFNYVHRNTAAFEFLSK